jgi:hypothetical protein
VLTSPLASPGKGDEPAAEIFIPGALALAAFILAFATLARKRRTR